MPRRSILFFIFCMSFGMQLVAMKKEKPNIPKPNIPKLNMNQVKRVQKSQRLEWKREEELKEIERLKKKLLKKATRKKNSIAYREEKKETFTKIILRKIKAGDLPYFQQRAKILKNVQGEYLKTVVKQSIFYCLNNHDDPVTRTAWQNPDHKTQNIKILLKLCKNKVFKTELMMLAQKKDINLRKLFDQTLRTYHVKRIPSNKKTKLPGIRADLKKLIMRCNPNAKSKTATTFFKTYRIKNQLDARSEMLADLLKTNKPKLEIRHDNKKNQHSCHLSNSLFSPKQCRKKKKRN